ncbi:MAG TPA: potassium-transporting ATPase subunit KdpC [Aggregatilineales bacterium]|nr:potassium-transporting ATPase subunit KdpC [Aggregatilineales bacterium]
MLKQLRAGIVAFALLTILVGLVYPIVMTALAQGLFPYQANGSVIVKNVQPIGSELIGQYFSDPAYFWPRPSATGPVPYTSFNADKSTGSTGSNFGPLNPALIATGNEKNPDGSAIPEGTVQTAIDAYHTADPENTAPIPVDLVTASASGLDPDISPAGAAYQVHRVAKGRGLDDATVQKLVDQYTQGRALGLLGEPHVNVLELNLALDALPNQHPPVNPVATAAATSPAATPAATTAATAAQ